MLQIHREYTITIENATSQLFLIGWTIDPGLFINGK